MMARVRTNMRSRNAEAIVAGVLVSLAANAHGQQNKPDVEPPPPPVYVMPRDGLLKPTLPRPQQTTKEAASDSPKPQARTLVAVRPRPPLRPPGPAAPEVPRPSVPEVIPVPPAPAASQPEAPVEPPVAKPPPTVAPPAPPVAQEQEEPPKALTVAGEYRLAMLAVSDGRRGSEGFGEQLNRVRLKVDARAASALSVHIENDFDLTTGNYLRSDALRNAQAGIDVPRQYWSARVQTESRSGYQLSSNLYRGYAKLGFANTDVAVGRQRVPLGTGLFWSALDMLNPPNPLRIESEEVLGVDALRIEHKLGSLSKADLVYAPDPDRRSSRWVAQYRRHIDASDLTFTYGKYWGDHLVGIDLATQMGNAGLRGEWAYTKPAAGRNYQKVLVAWDYAFANTLAVSFESFYSSQPLADRLAAAMRYPQMRFAQPPGNAYAGMTLGYDLTPLWRLSSALLTNLRDHSRMFYPSMAYSISDNLSVLAGGQFFRGGSETDFGSAGEMYFVRVQYYF